MTAKATTTFETKAGIKLTLRAVQSSVIGMVQTKVQQDFEKRGEMPEQPYVVIKSADGREYRQKLVGDNEDPKKNNLERADDPEATAQRIAQWEEFEEKMAEFSSAVNMESVVTYLALGCDYQMPADLADWEAMLSFAGQEIPENIYEKRALYLRTKLLDDDELLKVIEEITFLSNGATMSEDKRLLFRRQLRNSMEAAQEARFAQIGAGLGELGDEPAVSGDANGKGVAPDA